MTPGNWLLGWVLVGMMIGVGLWHGWWLLAIGGLVFGLFWWFAPDFLDDGPHEDPPEDIR